MRNVAHTSSAVSERIVKLWGLRSVTREARGVSDRSTKQSLVLPLKTSHTHLSQLSRQEAEKLAAAYGMRYVETSARDAINVERAFTELTRDIFELVKNGEITIQEGWEGVKSGFVPNVVHSSEEVTKGDRRCFC